MEDRIGFLSRFDKLEESYSVLHRLAGIECNIFPEAPIHQKSTDSLKRTLTCRTGCSEILNNPYTGEHDQPAVQQTFYNIDNIDAGNIPNFYPSAHSIANIRILLNGNKPLIVPITQNMNFEQIVQEIQKMIGRQLTQPILSQITRQIQDCIEKQSRQSGRSGRKERSKENRSITEQATVIKNRRKMLLNFSKKTLNQDVDIFCITHKLSAQTKNQILRGLKKDNRLIVIND